jgi:superfamily II DNA or RNA helicase
MRANGRTTPKGFQQTAIESGVGIFSECKRLLDAAGADAAGRAVAVGHHGILLIEAPTGAGKTLVAGHLAEKFSSVERVVWFWFAPFKGVVGQTAAALRAELPGLRLRELSEDRNAADSREGDVWVTTWQTVATKVKDRRNVHKPGEQNLTVEELIEGLRLQGLRVGVVIDEAHHGFFTRGGEETQAMKFYRQMLQPEYTVLVTATPDDTDIARFQKDLKLANLNRVSISRREPVDEGLIKEGIKCVAYLAPESQRALVDFEGTALRDGAAMHRKVRDEIKKLGVSLTPLMLVQVDSTAGVQRAKERLMREGFTEAQIAVHTADEPDSGLLAIANDESREVLVFKMAVALGFDAPRAGILVSMRAARDEDFGVQLVGRILRVHRRLQGRARAKSLPEILRHGYVFLADSESQEGLDKAGQRINALQTEYAKVSPTTAIPVIAGQPQVQALGQDGQTHLFRLDVELAGSGIDFTAGDEAARIAEMPGVERTTIVDLLTGGFSLAPVYDFGGTGKKASPPPPAGYRYELRAGVPRRFKTQIVSPDNEATEEDCAQRFILSSHEILRALAAKVKVQTRTLEVFTHQLELGFTNAAMDPEQAAWLAHKALTKNGTFDSRELRRALLRKLKATLVELGLEDVEHDEDKIAHMLNVILASQPELLYEAQKAARAVHFVVEEAEDELPPVLVNETPLTTSRLGAYGAIPPGLNSWEEDFVKLLDGDSLGIVKWWLRNLPHKGWSVQVVLADGRGFFPDFVIGMEGRKTELGALLADPKSGFETTAELPKSHAQHPLYGRVLILSRKGAQWMTVRYDEAQKRAVLDKEFLLTDAVGI